jgi:hypothetical protein
MNNNLQAYAGARVQQHNKKIGRLLLDILKVNRKNCFARTKEISDIC